MTIAVIGAGAIGSVVAGRLHEAGEKVLLVGHGDQVKAVNNSGLKIKTENGTAVVKVSIRPSLDKKYDLTIFTVKTQDLEAAYQENSGFLEGTVVLTTQNGVQADNILSSHFEKSQMISSIVMFGSTYVRPGEVTLNFPGNWIIGRPFGPNDGKVSAIAGVLKKAFPTVISDDIVGMKWLKLFVNFNNCLPAVIGKSMQETFADMDFCKLSVLLLKEGFAVVDKSGIRLVSLPDFPVERIAGLAHMPTEQGAGIINKTLTGLSKEPLYGSVLQSILRKRPSEIDFINGEVVHLAKQTRQEAPLNSRIVEMVHDVEKNNTFYKPEEVKDIFELGLKEAGNE